MGGLKLPWVPSSARLLVHNGLGIELRQELIHLKNSVNV